MNEVYRVMFYRHYYAGTRQGRLGAMVIEGGDIRYSHTRDGTSLLTTSCHALQEVYETTGSVVFTETYVRPGRWGPSEKHTAKLGVDYFDSMLKLRAYLRKTQRGPSRGAAPAAHDEHDIWGRGRQGVGPGPGPACPCPLGERAGSRSGVKAT